MQYTSTRRSTPYYTDLKPKTRVYPRPTQELPRQYFCAFLAAPILRIILLFLNNIGLREEQKRAALFATLQSGPWHVIALQETHHATQTEAAQWCRDGASPTPGVARPSRLPAAQPVELSLCFSSPAHCSQGQLAWPSCYGPPRQICCRAMQSQRQITVASVYAPVEK